MPHKNREERLACQRAWQREDYKLNKDYYKEAKKALQDRARACVADAKKGKSCACGESHPACLQFHHRPGTTKLFSVGDSARLCKGVKTIEREIAKCDLVCANCHFKLHWNDV